MDSTIYAIYSNAITRQYFMKYNDATNFISEISTGGISGFSTSGLFQEYSDYVVDITYFPINITLFLTTVDISTVKIGKSTVNVSDFVLSGDTTIPMLIYYEPYKLITDFTVTRYYNNFLDFSPYTKIKLYIPYFEEIELDPQAVYNYHIYCYMSVDTHSGQATLYVQRGIGTGGLLLATRKAQLGIKVPFGKTNELEQQRNRLLQGISLAGAVTGAVVGASTGNPIALTGAIAMGTNYLGKALSNEVDHASGYTGSSGGRNDLSVDKTLRLIIERPVLPTVPDYKLIGKPYNQNVTLSSLNGTGFTKVGNIEIDPSLNMLKRDITTEEIDLIVSKLKEGVYL